MLATSPNASCPPVAWRPRLIRCPRSKAVWLARTMMPGSPVMSSVAVLTTDSSQLLSGRTVIPDNGRAANCRDVDDSNRPELTPAKSPYGVGLVLMRFKYRNRPRRALAWLLADDVAVPAA